VSNTLWIWPDAPAGILSNDAGVILCDHCPCIDIHGNQCAACRLGRTPKWWRVYFTGVVKGDLGDCNTCPADWNDTGGFLIRQNSRADKSCRWDAREGSIAESGGYVVTEDYFTECYKHARVLAVLSLKTSTIAKITLHVNVGGTATVPPGPGETAIFEKDDIPAPGSRMNCFKALGYDLPLSFDPGFSDSICYFGNATCRIKPVLE